MLNQEDNNILLKSYDCIVLDLDGTLVYTSEDKEGDAIDISFNDYHGDTIKMWVHKRPGVDEFLRECFNHVKVGVWSMGQSGYVNAVVKELFPETPIFVYNWWDCDRKDGKIFKRLNNIPYNGNILMIDDKTDILEMCERINTFIVPEWQADEYEDTVLYDLVYLLFV
jgi:TFIIF-interacting CTD phosphatase-like protein